MDMISTFVRKSSGATSIEYAAIASAIAIAIVASVQGLGSKVNALFVSVSAAF